MEVTPATANGGAAAAGGAAAGVWNGPLFAKAVSAAIWGWDPLVVSEVYM